MRGRGLNMSHKAQVMKKAGAHLFMLLMILKLPQDYNLAALLLCPWMAQSLPCDRPRSLMNLC